MHPNCDNSEIELALSKVRSALEVTAPESTHAALLASLRILESLTESDRQSGRSAKYDGSIEYTFEDEDYEPFGRAVDVRVYYSWLDYNPADDPRPVWGATVEDVEVLAIRYFDEAGIEVPAPEHAADVGWLLLDKFHQQVTEACTEDGYHRGTGNAPLTYAPGRLRINTGSAAKPTQPDFGLRMVPSMPTRAVPREQRHFG